MKKMMIAMVSVLFITAISLEAAADDTRYQTAEAQAWADGGVVITQIAASYNQPEFFRNVVVGFHVDGRVVIFKVFADAAILTDRVKTAITRELRVAFHSFNHGQMRMRVAFFPRTNR